jgi:3-oxoacyl-[acyl-carrier-protein] synthase II
LTPTAYRTLLAVSRIKKVTIMKNRIVITGVGAVTAIGIGAESLWNGLSKGLCGVTHISSFDTSYLPCKRAAEVSNFNVRDYISQKGLNLLNRSTQFVYTAAKLALTDAKLDLPRDDGSEVGIVLGTAFGSANSMLAFDAECARDGLRFIDPMSFPNTVTNSPAGYLSVILGASGLNITISTDFASGLDAIDYASRALDSGQARIILAGGYDELSPASYAELAKAQMLSGSRGHSIEVSAPFDRRRNGFFLGEGAGVVVLERLDDARARKVSILAELAGYGTSFGPAASQAVESECKAMMHALGSAGLDTREIGYVSASANGSIEGDIAERLAIEKTFGAQASHVPVTANKSMMGECAGAAGAIQVVAAALSTRFSAVPPTTGFRVADPDSLLQKISSDQQIVDCGAVLVNSFNGQHNNSSVVVKRFFG